MMLQAAYYRKSPFMRNSLVESQLLKRNADLLTDLLAWLVQTPTVTTYRINLLKTTCEDFKKHLESCLSEKYAHAPRVYTLSDICEIICIDRLTKNEVLERLNDACSERKEIIVDVNCGAALLRGAHLYASGVLAMEKNTRLDEEVWVFADIEGKCKRGTNVRYESPYKVLIGVGVTRMQRHHIYDQSIAPSGVAVEMLAVQSGVPSMGNLGCNEALLQNLPSIVCVRALNPQPGEIVLDMCAAPGNKTTHIAEMMRDKGIVMALDKTVSRVSHIIQKAEAQGYVSIKSYVFDATTSFHKDATATSISADMKPPFAANSFDRILLDAPCSALGNRPVLSINLTPKMLSSFPKLQRKLFQNAVALLKPQGTLIYSTCTITEEENENMVEWTLRKHPELQLVDALPRYGGYGLRNAGLTDEQRMLVQRFGPNFDSNSATQVDTVGFFIAKFIKISAT